MIKSPQDEKFAIYGFSVIPLYGSEFIVDNKTIKTMSVVSSIEPEGYAVFYTITQKVPFEDFQGGYQTFGTKTETKIDCKELNEFKKMVGAI